MTAPEDDDRHAPGDHPVPTDGVTPEDRTRALQSLLVEKELLSTDTIDEIVSAYEEEIGPMNGAEVVARAWTDPDYRDWLLADGTAAIAEMGYTGAQGVDIEVKANTPDTHNAIVCTLCSCYPWPVLGLPPTWYKSPPYRSKIVKRPRETLREEFGVAIADDTAVRVWDSSSEVRYMVLPQRPPETEGMDREELVEAVTRDSMIGVERLVGAPATDGGASEGVLATETTRSSAVEETVASVRADSELPADDGDVVFAAPWQARAFAMVVRLRHDDRFAWSAFQRRLVEAVDAAPDGPADPETAYYEQWLAAFERLLVDEEMLAPAELGARAAAFAAGERDASEFVHGDGHSHEGSEHGHSHGHEHAHGHDHGGGVEDEPVARDPPS
jgi:nitrile hydratase alpha subunit/nitrile hydratase accessory protein